MPTPYLVICFAADNEGSAPSIRSPFPGSQRADMTCAGWRLLPNAVGDCAPGCVQELGRTKASAFPFTLFALLMLTHGKEVRRVSFLLGALEGLFVMAFQRVGKVSFLVRSGYLLTFISVKYSIN